MPADRAEDRILISDCLLDGSFLEHVSCGNGEACMPGGQGKRVAREGGDGISLIQRLFHQALTGGSGGSK